MSIKVALAEPTQRRLKRRNTLQQLTLPQNQHQTLIYNFIHTLIAALETLGTVCPVSPAVTEYGS